jgi:hypothetical protein
MTRTPIIRLAIHFDMAREISEPAKPMTAEKISSAVRSRPIVEARAQATFSALRVEGAFRNPKGADSWEYSVVVSIRNDRGEEVDRKVVGVGALDPNESRTVTLSVDVFAPRGSK